MKFKRVIPVLTMIDDELYKTVQFESPRYVGDAINAVRIFNEKQVDEIIIADIRISANEQEPSFDLIKDIVSEAFMPVCYAGGVATIEQFKTIIQAGVEKIAISTHLADEALLKACVAHAGSSSVVACFNVVKEKGIYYSDNKNNKQRIALADEIKRVEQLGVGEIMINDSMRDGTYQGYDEALLKFALAHTDLPLIYCGGAAGVEDFKKAFELGADAVAAGSLFMFYGKWKAVLINYLNDQQRTILKDFLPL